MCPQTNIGVRRAQQPSSEELLKQAHRSGCLDLPHNFYSVTRNFRLFPNVEKTPFFSFGLSAQNKAKRVTDIVKMCRPGRGQGDRHPTPLSFLVSGDPLWS